MPIGLLIHAEMKISRLVKQFRNFIHQIPAYIIVLPASHTPGILTQPLVMAGGKIELGDRSDAVLPKLCQHPAELLFAQGTFHGKFRMGFITDPFSQIDDKGIDPRFSHLVR